MLEVCGTAQLQGKSTAYSSQLQTCPEDKYVSLMRRFSQKMEDYEISISQENICFSITFIIKQILKEKLNQDSWGNQIYSFVAFITTLYEKRSKQKIKWIIPLWTWSMEIWNYVKQTIYFCGKAYNIMACPYLPDTHFPNSACYTGTFMPWKMWQTLKSLIPL